jgi:hypothetical protein
MIIISLLLLYRVACKLIEIETTPENYNLGKSLREKILFSVSILFTHSTHHIFFRNKLSQPLNFHYLFFIILQHLMQITIFEKINILIVK